MEADRHSAKPDPSVAKHLADCSPWIAARTPRCVSALCFFGPEPRALGFRKGLETLEELLGQARPSPRLEPQGLGFEFIDVHRPIVADGVDGGKGEGWCQRLDLNQ